MAEKKTGKQQRKQQNQSWFFEMIIQIDESLAMLQEKKETGHKPLISERGVITTDLRDIKGQ